MTPQLEALLREAEELDTRATRGPWIADANLYGGGCFIVGPDGKEILADVRQRTRQISRDQAMAEAMTMARSRTLLPAIAAELRAMDAEVSRITNVTAESVHGSYWEMKERAEKVETELAELGRVAAVECGRMGRELGTAQAALAEKDAEIARLREALQEIANACPQDSVPSALDFMHDPTHAAMDGVKSVIGNAARAVLKGPTHGPE